MTTVLPVVSAARVWTLRDGTTAGPVPGVSPAGVRQAPSAAAGSPARTS